MLLVGAALLVMPGFFIDAAERRGNRVYLIFDQICQWKAGVPNRSVFTKSSTMPHLGADWPVYLAVLWLLVLNQ